MPRLVPGSDRATLDALVAFMKARLAKPAVLHPGEPSLAFAETPDRFNETSWFWTDDNAKAAELLCEPAYYDADPATADAAIDFVLEMSRGAIIQRRGGPAEVRVTRADPAAFRVETAFFFLEGDLTRAEVRHGLRFNDNRTVTAVEHAGHWVAFRYGRRMLINLADSVESVALRQDGRSVTLSFTSTLHPLALFRGPGKRVLGRVTFTYTISADRPAVALVVTAEAAPGVKLKNVVVATVLDRLDRVHGVGYRSLAIRTGPATRAFRDITKPSVAHPGAADYSAVLQERASPGFSYAIHTLFRDRDRLAGITARVGPKGRLHRVVHRYGLATLSGATTCVVAEDRMLTGGGYYDVLDHYMETMRSSAGGGTADPSMSYDIGAELNAVAVHLLFALSGQYAAPPSTERLASLSAWYARHVARYFAFIAIGTPGDLERTFTRGIAFVVLSLDCMLRATGEERYRAWLEAGVGLILRLARSEQHGRDIHLTFGDIWSRQIPFLDCHAACILALARAARHGDRDGAMARTIHAAILSMRLYTGSIDIGLGQMRDYDGLAVIDMADPARHADTGFWNFKLGLVLRALHAVRRAAQAGAIAMTEAEETRLRRRLSLAKDLLAGSFRQHGTMLEVLTSAIAGETNSETQPWVALGLVPILDAMVERTVFGDTGRSPLPADFAEDRYLGAHPDVKDAVERGDFPSGLHHWFAFGDKERRSLS